MAEGRSRLDGDPHFFEPESIIIEMSRHEGEKDVVGDFAEAFDVSL